MSCKVIKTQVMVMGLLLFIGAGCISGEQAPEAKQEPAPAVTEATKKDRGLSLEEREYQFQKKQECEKYQASIKKALEAEAFTVPSTGLQSSTQLVTIFYSPKLNTCLYGSQDFGIIGNTMKGGTYMISDALTAKLLDSFIYGWNDENVATDRERARKAFESKVEYYSSWEE